MIPAYNQIKQTLVANLHDYTKVIQAVHGFRRDVIALVPKSKYGRLAGKCEFENMYAQM
jgi:hypothetical protein